MWVWDSEQQPSSSFNLSPTWLALTFPQQTMASLSPLFNHFLTYLKHSCTVSQTRPCACIDTNQWNLHLWKCTRTHTCVYAQTHTHKNSQRREIAAISLVWYHPQDARAELKCGTCLWCESRAWACNKRRYQITPCPALILKTPCLLLQR